MSSRNRFVWHQKHHFPGNAPLNSCASFVVLSKIVDDGTNTENIVYTLYQNRKWIADIHFDCGTHTIFHFGKRYHISPHSFLSSIFHSKCVCVCVCYKMIAMHIFLLIQQIQIGKSIRMSALFISSYCVGWLIEFGCTHFCLSMHFNDAMFTRLSINISRNAGS